MLTVDEQTREFAEIYTDFQRLRVLTPDLLGRLYGLLDRAEFLTFGPFETVVSDYLTARAEHSGPDRRCECFLRAYGHFSRIQAFSRASGCAFRCAELFWASARSCESDEDILEYIQKSKEFAARALAAAALSREDAKFGFSAEGLRFAKVQAKLDEIDAAREVRNQREADAAVRRLAALEEEARALETQSGGGDIYKIYTFDRIRQFYAVVAARAALMGLRGGNELKMRPSAAVALSTAEALQALAARGDFDLCMSLVVHASVSPSCLIQYLTKFVVDELAAFWGETDNRAPQLTFLTSYLSKYEHKFAFEHLGVKMGADVEKKLETCLSALFDCLYHTRETKTGNSGFSQVMQLSGDVYTEYVASIFVLSHRYACKNKIIDCLRLLGPGPFDQGVFARDGQIHTDLLQTGKLYDMEQEIRDYFSGQQQKPELIQPGQQVYKQQSGNVYRAPGGVKTNYQRGTTAGAGTFVQGHGIIKKQNNQLQLDDLTVQKRSEKKVAFAF